MLTKGVIAAAKAGPKLYKKFDGGGLHIAVTPAGSKLWRMVTRYQGRRIMLSFGAWPDVDIEQARGLRSAAKAALRNGRDPRGAKPVAGDTFGAYADAHIRRLVEIGRAEKTVSGRKWLLGYPAENGAPAAPGLARALRPVPMGSITAPGVIAVLRPLEDAGKLETARKLRIAIGKVIDRAIVDGIITSNPCLALGEEDVMAPAVVHRPAVVDRDGFKGLLRSIACYRGDRLFVTRDALRLLALTALRPGEARLSRWADIDLDKRTWTIDASRAKMRKPHVIPLADRAVDILTGLQQRTGGAEWVFPSPRDPDKPLSTNALSAALTAMGYHGVHCPHGFRASFRSLAAESGRWSDAAVKLQMSHAIGDAVTQAYDRSPRWKERVELAQWWSLECEHMERVARLVG